jgi:hypothetical protein
MSDSISSAVQTIKAAASKANAAYLAAMLDGPDSTLGLAALGHVLLGDDCSTAADIAAVVERDDPDLAMQLQQAEQQCLSRKQRADPSWLAAFPVGNIVTPQDEDNTLDARKRQIELHDNTNRVLAYVVTGGLFLLIVMLMAFGKWFDPTIKDLLFTLLGVVATGWANIIGFYFGSSAGSQQKSLTIGAALNQSIRQSGSS